MRLDKFVCKSTALTRTEATRAINAGELSVNGNVVLDAATQVHENNRISLYGQILKARDFRYILLHKPANTICSNVDEVYPSVFTHIDVENPAELHVAGRLDADTTGLVLVTDDGRWSFDIIRPTRRCEKVYRVGLSYPIADDVAQRFADGLQLQGEQKLTRPAVLEVVTPKEVLLTITEGRFHQVKRMFAAVGNRVLSLHRERIGQIGLDVAVGQWRYLSTDEIGSFG
ncbi:16S rRNA pseudouridine(516) synthase [Marinobacterium aestuarii]|uniref:Pseudouridine synthase n=1 Tax=Marinobacterium aestuarii TaxID=1821621 RepID=A0A1A9F5Z5_9GAMM|nr:pseudouridine synthase [Marinobacterium aestuarii]ANG65318.1 16S rRNA pseudouridine(516) synthase [Marinobacterium aestuarii]